MIHDKSMDEMIKDIIEIFNMEGVELVRLSGLTKRASDISNMNIPPETLDNILHKLKFAGVINYEYITICPFCKEKSYQIKQINNNGKICDTCGSYFTISDSIYIDK